MFWSTIRLFQLISDIDQAESYRAGGQVIAAQNSLVHYNDVLQAGNTGGSVKSSAYWLLKANAEIVRGIL